MVTDRVLNRYLRSGDCLISIIPDSASSASSLFRPRRFTPVFGGVFLLALQ